MKKFHNKDSILVFSEIFDDDGVRTSVPISNEINLSNKEHIKKLHERLDNFIRLYRYGYPGTTLLLHFENQQPELPLPFDK